MANWSTIYIDVKSNDGANSIKEFANELLQYSKEYSDLGIRTALEPLEVKKITNSIYQCSIEGEGRRKAPEFLYGDEIFKKYNLSGYIEDSEPSSDFFYKAEYEKGKLVNKVDEEYFCKESIKAWDVGFWLEHYTEDFGEYGWENCEDIRSVFNEAGYSDDWLKLMYYHEDVKKIVFIVGNNGTGKTELAKEMNKDHSFAIIKSDTTRPQRNAAEAQWYNFKEGIAPSEMVEINEFGGYLYGTPKKELDLCTHQSMCVKIIEPKGLRAMLNHLKNREDIITSIVHMDIDKDTVISNLKKEGIPLEEIEERVNRGNIVGDLEKYDIKPDVIVTELNEKTAVDTVAKISRHFIEVVEREKIAKIERVIGYLSGNIHVFTSDKNMEKSMKEMLSEYFMQEIDTFKTVNDHIEVSWDTSTPFPLKANTHIDQFLKSLLEKAKKEGINIDTFTQKEALQEYAKEYIAGQDMHSHPSPQPSAL